ASSRSLSTTRAPSRANLSASARPMPRPPPVTSATFPASLVIYSTPLFSLDDRVAEERGVPARIDNRKLQRQPLPRAALFGRGNDSDAFETVVHVRYRRKAHTELAQRLRPELIRERPAKIGHRQHALRQHLIHARRPRHIQIDVHGVVIVRRASEQRERRTTDRRSLEQRDAIPWRIATRAGCAAHFRVLPWRTTTVLVISTAVSPC